MLKFLKVPSHTCAPISIEQARDTSNLEGIHNVVIVYKSGVYNFDSREKLRKHYRSSNSSLKFDVMFSIGVPRMIGGNLFDRGGFKVTLRDRSGEKMKENAKNPNATRNVLEKEMLAYDDLLIGDYEDSYYNLTTKLFHTFQWAARFCRPYKPIMIFIDDDYAVNIRYLENFLRTKSSKETNDLRHGFYLGYNPVHRSSSLYPQWALSKREIPWTFHARQHLGIYSLWSYRYVVDMALAMHFTKPLVIDDTWLALVQRKMKIDFSNLPGMFIRAKQSYDSPCSSIFFARLEDIIFKNCTK